MFFFIPRKDIGGAIYIAIYIGLGRIPTAKSSYFHVVVISVV